MEQAQQIALRNHPRIASAELAAQASGFAVKEARSAYYPTLSGNVTGVGTEHGSVLSAGAVTTSSIYSRQSSGVVANQLITDFGRTANLTKSAKLRNESQNQNVTNTRAQVLVNVQQAYYRALAAQSVLKVAQATLDLRRVTLRQVTALAQSALRSTVDVSFAQVNESQAELDLFHAENDATASHSELSAAMGYDHDQPFSLSDEPLPAPLDPNVDALIEQAERERPDLAALRLNQRGAGSICGCRERSSKSDHQRCRGGRRGALCAIPGCRKPTAPRESISTFPFSTADLFKARREEAEVARGRGGQGRSGSVGSNRARRPRRLAERQRCVPAPGRDGAHGGAGQRSPAAGAGALRRRARQHRRAEHGAIEPNRRADRRRLGQIRLLERARRTQLHDGEFCDENVSSGCYGGIGRIAGRLPARASGEAQTRVASRSLPRLRWSRRRAPIYRTICF